MKSFCDILIRQQGKSNSIPIPDLAIRVCGPFESLGNAVLHGDELAFWVAYDLVEISIRRSNNRVGARGDAAFEEFKTRLAQLLECVRLKLSGDVECAAA